LGENQFIWRFERVEKNKCFVYILIVNVLLVLIFSVIFYKYYSVFILLTWFRKPNSYCHWAFLYAEYESV